MLLTGTCGVAKLACVDLQKVEVSLIDGANLIRASMRQPGCRPAFRMSGGVGRQTLRPDGLHDVTSSHAFTPSIGHRATHGDVLAVSDCVDVRGDVARKADLDAHGRCGGLWCVPGTPAMSGERWPVNWTVGQGKLLSRACRPDRAGQARTRWLDARRVGESLGCMRVWTHPSDHSVGDQWTSNVTGIRPARKGPLRPSLRRDRGVPPVG